MKRDVQHRRGNNKDFVDEVELISISGVSCIDFISTIVPFATNRCKYPHMYIDVHKMCSLLRLPAYRRHHLETMIRHTFSTNVVLSLEP